MVNIWLIMVTESVSWRRSYPQNGWLFIIENPILKWMGTRRYPHDLRNLHINISFWVCLHHGSWSLTAPSGWIAGYLQSYWIVTIPFMGIPAQTTTTSWLKSNDQPFFSGWMTIHQLALSCASIYPKFPSKVIQSKSYKFFFPPVRGW